MTTEFAVLKPKNLSTYELRERLGEGLSGQVIAAVRRDADKLSEQSVVLKILKSETAVSWLQKEFTALSSVHSPYCVRVLGWETFDQGPALVLERIEGVTLHDLGRRFQLDEREIDELAYQVEQGLAALHTAGVFHGDLSPKNILITPKGGVKLIDFGSAIGDGDLIGTPAYVPSLRWQKQPPSREADFASWALIALDLRTHFATVPTDIDAAQLRAAEFANVNEEPVRTASFALERASIGRKVEVICAERKQISGSTVVIPAVRATAASAPPPRKRMRALASVLLFVISTPVFSTPEQIGTPPGALRISTMKWVEISVDEGLKRYAPFQVKIGAGRHRLQWRSQRGSGEFEVVIAADQVRTLHDTNFRR